MVVSNTPVSSSPVLAKTTEESTQRDIKGKLEEIKETQSIKKERTKTEESKVKKLDPNETVRIIVEFKDEAVSSAFKKYNKLAKQSEKKSLKKQENYVKKIEKITGNKCEKKFAYLINAVSIDAKRSQIDEIKKIDNVKSVYEANTYEPVMNDAVEEGRVRQVWEDYNLPLDGEGMLVSVIDTGVNFNHKDMRLDSGKKVKFTKEQMQEKIKSLGHGKYINNKVPYAYDYVDNTNDVKIGTANHGCHVGGIVGANKTSSSGVEGVCPNAQVISMQVFNSEGEFCLSDDAVMAIEDSVKIGADVINMSLGTPGGWTETDHLMVEAVNKADDQGCIVSVAAGNDYTSVTACTDLYTNPYGLKDIATISTPASAVDSLSVAACYNDNEKLDASTPKMAEFSSWGPTMELQIKPEVTAPGKNIISTDNGTDNYINMSGTSMAAPFVSGVATLVKEGVIRNNLKISGDELSDYVRYNIINTASPLMDQTYGNGEDPYSVRQQGSGLINAKAAVDNRVIATYKGDATIELGSIKEGTYSIPIEIKLKNYGDKDKTYKLGDCPIYTDLSGTKYKAEDEVFYRGTYALYTVDGGKIAFATNSVTVKAGSEAKVNAQVIIPKDMKANQYIEGFVKLNGDIPLNMPLLGFYGDWESVQIFDAPNSDENSVIGSLGIDSRYCVNSDDEALGVTYKIENGKEKAYVDESKTAISNSVLSLNRAAYPVYTLLRGSYKTNVSVYDSNGKLVKNLGNVSRQIKSMFMNAQFAGPQTVSTNSIAALGWDGTRYDTKTGKNVSVSDGDYYFEITAQITKNAKQQKIKMPVRVDSVDPNVETKYEYKNGYFNIYVKASDNFALSPYVEVSFTPPSMSDEVTKYNLDTDFVSDKNGYRKLSLKMQEPLYYSIRVKDMAGNYKFSNPINYNGSTLNPSDDEDLLAPSIKTTFSSGAIKKYETYHGITNGDDETSLAAMLAGSPANMDIYFEVKDDSNLIDESLAEELGLAPVMFVYDVWVDNPDNPSKMMADKVYKNVEKVGTNKYKVSLTASEIKTGYEYGSLGYIKNNTFSATVMAIDEYANVRSLYMNIYASDNEEDYANELHMYKGNPIMTENGALDAIADLSSNGDKYMFAGFIEGLSADSVTVNGANAKFVPVTGSNYEEHDQISVFGSEVTLKPGYNVIHVEAYKNISGKKTKVGEKYFGRIIYNGKGADIVISAGENINNGVYECQSNKFVFEIYVKSAMDTYCVRVNDEVIYDFNDIALSKKTNDIRYTYNIEGSDVNIITVSTSDVCGNVIEKKIKVKNVGPQTKKNIKNTKVTVESKKAYTGKKIKAKVKVVDGKTTLKKGVDYKLTYKNNKKIGKAKVVVKGIGKYTGSINKTFKIVPGKVKVKKVSKRYKGTITFKLKKVKGGVKYEYYYSKKKRGKYKKFATSKKLNLKTKKLKKGTKYFVKVRAFKKVKKTKYYGSFSKIKVIK